MKVLNLRCSQAHDFEGWFASEEDYAEQSQRGLLGCPLCGDTVVHKMPSAPRLNLGGRSSGADAPSAERSTSTETAVAPDVQAQGRLLSALRTLMSQTEDVGDRFAQEARAMHQGEIANRNIRGRASVQEAVELLEDGVEILPLPDLPGLKSPLQ